MDSQVMKILLKSLRVFIENCIDQVNVIFQEGAINENRDKNLISAVCTHLGRPHLDFCNIPLNVLLALRLEMGATSSQI